MVRDSTTRYLCAPPHFYYLVLVLRVNLSWSDVFEQQGEGFRGGVSGGEVERGHLLQIFLQPVSTPGQQQFQESHVALQHQTTEFKKLLRKHRLSATPLLFAASVMRC